MTLDRFERERSGGWQALEAALGKARGKPERLGAAGVLESAACTGRPRRTSRWRGGSSPATR